jgi:hypothetical protein
MKMDEKEESEYASAIRAMIQHEDKNTNNRLTWLLVLQGILFATSASFWRIHWLPFSAIGILGILTSISFFYVLWLSYRGRIYLRELWKNRVNKKAHLENNIPPVTGDVPQIIQLKILLPRLFLPWAIILCWVVILIVGIAMGTKEGLGGTS